MSVAIAPIAIGCKNLEEIGYSWWLLPLCTTEEAREFCGREGIEACSAGPGQFFAGRPSIRHSLSYTLVCQRSGLDV